MNNIEKDLIKAVEVVNEALESLRYFGQLKNNVFTGESIDITIVTLPELLLDFRIDNLLKRDEAGKVCTIGGKATRTSKILWGLVSQEDEIIVPYLITKTSPLGFLMLKNELSEINLTKLFNSKYQDYIYVDNEIQEPRCAARLKNGKYSLKSSKVECDVEIKIKSENINNAVFPRAYIGKHELSDNDINNNQNTIQIINDARVILLASMTTPHFEKIYETIINNIEPNSKKLYLDLSRHIGHETINNQIEYLKPDIDKIGCIFIPKDNIQLDKNVTKEDSLKRFEQLKDIPIIVYGENPITLFLSETNGRNNEKSFENDIDFVKENVNEAFKAGVMLARAVFSSINDISKFEIDKNFKLHMNQAWLNSWSISILYGIALAKYVQKRGLLDSYEEFVKDYIKHNSSVDLSVFDLKLPAEIIKNAGSKALSFSHPNLSVLKGLSVLRQNKKLDNPSLTHCIDIKCEKGCLGNEDDITKKRAAVLLDLDGTLIDSENQRNRMISKAISQLIEDCLEKTEFNFKKINETIKDFNKYVYGLWPIYNNAKIGNFRQKWNHPGWYICLLVFASDDNLFNRIKIWYQKNEIEKRNNNNIIILSKTDIEWVADFKEAYYEIEEKYYNLIQKTRNIFSETKIYPFRGVFDFLISLKQTNSCELYIVTEGEPETQWLKIVNSGLDLFFDRNHILTTSDAGEYSSEVEKLKWEKGQLKFELDNVKFEKEKTDESLNKIHKLEDDLYTRFYHDNDSKKYIKILIEKHTKDLISIKNLTETKEERIKKILIVTVFVQKVIDRLSQKGGKAFYSAVIRAIINNPKNALTELRSFENLIKDAHVEDRMKFVMIGDRQDNDIGWPKALLDKNILAIRLISGKYAKDPEQNEAMTEKVNEKLRPDYIVHTLSQAKLLLLNKDIWTGIPCLWNIPVFDWQIDLKNINREAEVVDYVPYIGLEYILLGMELHKPKYELTNNICSGVFCDYLLTKSGNEITNILIKIFNSENNCVGRKASVLFEFIRGVIAKGQYEITDDILLWLSIIIKKFDIKNNNSDDPLFADYSDIAYHMQQCSDSVHLLCNYSTSYNPSIRQKICILLRKVISIVDNDDELRGRVNYRNCHCNNINV